MASAAEPDREFNCSECNTKVKNLAYLTDEQASVEAENSNACFFSTRSAMNVIHVMSPLHMTWTATILKRRMENSNPNLHTIKTARTLTEMNFAIANGSILLLQRAGDGRQVRQHLAVSRNNETGKIVFSDDVRYPHSLHVVKSEYTTIIDFFEYHPAGLSVPVAAYVIPKDLPVGVDVFVEDVIEDLVVESSQNTSERLSGWWAVWDGAQLNFQPHDSGVILG